MHSTANGSGRGGGSQSAAGIEGARVRVRVTRRGAKVEGADAGSGGSNLHAQMQESRWGVWDQGGRVGGTLNRGVNDSC